MREVRGSGVAADQDEPLPQCQEHQLHHAYPPRYNRGR